jgi:NADH-quinone oxidoreductase subunit E
MSAHSLVEEIRRIASRYPSRRSAVMAALRLAQERDGYLSPEAISEVADALDLSPAFCLSIASYYDMYRLEPGGKHSIEICTNASCALVGAEKVLEAFESELGIRAGETTADGTISLLTVECLGGCGFGTVVAIDHRYRSPVRPEDVAQIVEELSRG